MLTVAKRPCGSCPYRKDVPSGIWAREEYEKLPLYDGPTWQQTFAVFMCHQRDGNLCAGWLACHGPWELLALRIARLRNEVDPAVMSYATDVPVFASGACAHAHGVRDLKKKTPRAIKMLRGLWKKRNDPEKARRT